MANIKKQEFLHPSKQGLNSLFCFIYIKKNL